MQLRIAGVVMSLPLVLAACASSQYTAPEASGLINVRPYPNPNDVCVIVGENAATRDFLDDSSLLIGCPNHERGAITDREKEGASVVAQVGDWTLLAVPDLNT